MKVQVPEGMLTADIVKRMFWLAWQACGGTLGLGFLQDNAGADEDAVWSQVQTQGDYPGAARTKKGEADGDYVFGRMMKLYIRFTETEIELREDAPRHDYQAWCGKYPSYKALFDVSLETFHTSKSE